MEQLQFDVGTLQESIEMAVEGEIAANEDALAVLRSARSSMSGTDGSYPADEELIKWLSRCIADATVKEVVRYNDYDPDSFAAFFNQNAVTWQAISGGHNPSKANALPSWSNNPRKWTEELNNCVITGWPGFDHTLSQAARVAVKDTMKNLTVPIVVALATGIASAGLPEVAALTSVILTYVGIVVAETMSSLATVAFGLQRIDPSMQCVYQRSMRIARNSRSAVMGGQHEVSVKDVLKTFADDKGGMLDECGDLYHAKVPKCPFLCQTGLATNKCSLVNPSLRPKVWNDDEDGEVKIRRVMGELKAQGVLTSKIERNRDSFFRANRLITSNDMLERR